ncbi:hypothetical protein [Pseudomonas aeruginosa]|uniref:hypothetical protein n=1 Tax=Pseudomonas aeruginosa TaxID=287 RepID=UPI0015F118A2|nr:hypothetical protein [Pseudomonas aeruginosa]MBA4870781.1 hypothetical protein [Pseudomonas aeruginosa]MBA4988956.1 hypothetical protein [Pseudomonas aeruginosa]
MTASKIQMDQIRSTSATVTGENIRAGSQKKSSLSPAEGLQGASPDATCTCPSGGGSLRHPCPAHPAVEQAGGDERDFQAEGAQEVPSPVSQEYDRHLISLLRKGEALPGHQEEAADEIERLRDWNDHLNNTVLPNILNPNFLMLMKGGERLLDLCTKDGKFIGVSLNDMKDVFDWMVTHARIAPDHAALAQPSPMRCLACGGYHGNSGLPCPNMRVTAQAQPSPAQAEQHWPKLEKPAQVGAIRFSAGVSSRLVVEAAQRLYEFESTPEKEAERIERLQAFREQLDPLNLAPHAEAFNEAPAEALKPEPAEADRPEVVARVVHSNPVVLGQCGPLNANDELMTVAQHAASVARWAEMFNRVEQERDAALAEVERLRESKGDPVGSLEKCMKVMYERDEHAKRLEVAQARVAELEKQEPVATVAKVPGEDWNGLHFYRDLQGMQPGTKLYAAPVAQAQQLHDLDKQCRDDVARALGLRPNQERGFAWSYLLASIKSCVKASGDSAQAQHSAGYAEARQCVNCRHIGINDAAADYAACHDCRWTGPEPDEDKCPGCAGENCMAAACPECGGRYELVAEAKISTPAAQAGQMPQAWLDVQAERRRQITAEGWTPEHDDLYCAAELPRAAAAYILNGANDEAPAIWPFVAKWWKPRDARSNYVRAGALILAEIERLDRAAPGKEVGHE